MSSATEDLNFQLKFIVSDLNASSSIWPEAVTLDSRPKRDTTRLSKRTQKIQVVRVGNWTRVSFGREKSKSDRIQDGSEIKWGSEKYRKHAGKSRLLWEGEQDSLRQEHNQHCSAQSVWEKTERA